MQTSGKWPISVCTWSFRKPVEEIGSVMTALGLEHVHLDLTPALGAGGEAYLDAVRAQGWTVTSAMLAFAHEDYSTLDTIKVTGGIAPDDKWPASGEAFAAAAKIAAGLGTRYISLHVGFLDHTDAAYAKKFEERVRFLGDAAAEAGVSLLMETGQESAEELQRFLETLNHPHIFLNFDPANLILYNKDEPLAAVRRLAPWIRHVHVKDALRTREPGTWGSEVAWGDGEVNAFAFLNALREIGYDGALAVEREAGDQRVKDIALAVRRLMAY